MQLDHLVDRRNCAANFAVPLDTAWPNVGRKKEAVHPRTPLPIGCLLQPSLHPHFVATVAKGQGSCDEIALPAIQASVLTTPSDSAAYAWWNHPRHGHALQWASAQKKCSSLTPGLESASPVQDSAIVSALPVQPLLKFH